MISFPHPELPTITTLLLEILLAGCGVPMVKRSKESLKAEKSRVNQLLDEENRTCNKCKDKKGMGCEGCFHDKRKKALQKKKEEIQTALAAH
jgi:hypothetical protein